MAFITLKEVEYGFGGPPLLDNINLQIEPGERIGLVGRNGAGKSTLLKILCGALKADGGEIIRSQDARIALLPQEVPEDISGTAFEVVLNGILPESEETDTPEAWEARRKAESVLSRMDILPEERFENLSAGRKRWVLLARALADEPTLLLLDEPTNHLDIEAIAWLETFLLKFVKTLLFITHDRVFLQNLSNRIIELDRGGLASWKCNYTTYLERKAAALEVEETHREKFKKKLAEEEVWLRKGLKARRTRNEGRVRALLKMREERRSWRKRMGTVNMQAQEARRTGRLVAESRNISYAWENRPIVKDFSTIITRGDKIAIIGPNGAGKTTLLNLLLGRLTPDAGSIRHGEHLEIAYFDQLRGQLDETLSVQDNISDGNDRLTINGNPRHIISYLKDFLFSPERARSPVSILSGGERNRLLLAKLFAKPSNVLVLDEPTNDLDAETLELLEELIMDYSGTVILVSHDRAFINNVVTHTFVFEGQGQVTEYAGGYDDWLLQRPEDKKEKPEIKATKPQKERDKKANRVRKLSFNEKRELEQLPEQIESMEAEQEKLTVQMSDPEFYKTESGEIARMKERMEALEQKLAEAYERWEELEAIETDS